MLPTARGGGGVSERNVSVRAASAWISHIFITLESCSGGPFNSLHLTENESLFTVSVAQRRLTSQLATFSTPLTN